MAQMATGTANRSAVSTSNNSWAGRFSDFGGVASSTNKENNAPSGNASASQKFGGNGTWASGIWGSSALGNRFTSGNQNSTRPRDEKAFPSSHATTGSEGKSGSGSLVASSESDTWNNRPWGAVDATSPSYPTQIKSAAISPVRHRNSNQNPPPQSLGVRGRDTSPYFTVRQAAIGQGVLDKSPNKSYLNPTSLTFIANQGDDENGGGSGFPTLIGGNDSQSRNINSTFGFFDENEAMAQSEQQHDLGYLDRRASAVSSRTSSLPGSRHDPTSGLGVQYQSQDTSAFSQFPKTASSLSSHRAHRSGNSSSISSQSNGIKYDDVTSGAKDAEAMLGNMKLVDGTRGGFYGQVPSGTVGLNDSHYGHNELQQNQIPSFRPSRVGDRDSLLPSSTDYRRSLNSPHYSTGGTPPAAANRLRTPPYGMHQGQGPTDAHTAALDRKLRGLQQEQQGYMHPTHPMMNAQFRGQYGYPYDYGHHGPMSLNPLAPYFPMPGMGPIPPNSLAPRGPSRELDVGQNLRSALLEEFRSNSKTSKRYELKDIYNHIVEFSGDQHGSRFIQQKLETANSDEKDQVFREIQPNSIQLMTDVFGNYVIQKFFEHGNQAQKKILANQMKGNVLSLSLQMYGCRVVQKALEHILTDQQASLVKELEAHVLKCVKDQNGNHVIQKAIERVPSEHIEFINQAFKGQIQSLATHPYGCRVIQRMLEHSDSTAQVSILQELHSCAASLIIDQYGNYVSQHVIEHGGPEDKSRIIKIVTAQIVHFSKHKFASNVVEKSIQFGSDDQRREILATLTVMNSKGEIPLQALMRDQFGNYVIQKLLAQLKGADRERLVDQIKQQLPQIKKYSYGKQINAIEKLIYTSSSPSQSTTPPPSSEVDRSAAPTPPLTAGAQSPQTSSLPSTNTSTVEEPIHQDSPNKTDEAENGGAVRVAAVES